MYIAEYFDKQRKSLILDIAVCIWRKESFCLAHAMQTANTRKRGKKKVQGVP